MLTKFFYMKNHNEPLQIGASVSSVQAIENQAELNDKMKNRLKRLITIVAVFVKDLVKISNQKLDYFVQAHFFSQELKFVKVEAFHKKGKKR
jgi:hypothetical protein